MAKFFIVSVVIILFLAVSKPSYATNIAKNICEYVAVDDKGRFRKLLKSSRLKIRSIYSDVNCNNKSILLFAAERGSIKIGQLLIKKLPKGELKKHIPALEASSEELASLAKERTK